MTLDIKKLIRNAVVKQFKVAHIDDCNVQVFSKQDLENNAPQACGKIKDTYGEEFLGDSTYVLFISKINGFSKDEIEDRIFKAVDKALGEKANKMNPSDLKTLSFKTSETNTPAEETPAEEPEATTEEPVADDNTTSLDESVEKPEPNEEFVFLKITTK